MRRLAVGSLLVAACGGGQGGTDASGNDGPAVVVDAGYDAGGCVAGPDTDGDGICDADDACPMVADPAQLDLDGDGHGWSCDDQESFVLDGATTPEPTLEALVDSDVLAGVFRLGCTAEGCDNRVLLAGPRLAYVSMAGVVPLDRAARGHQATGSGMQPGGH